VAAGSRQCYEIGNYSLQNNAGVHFSTEVCTSPVVLPPPPPPLDFGQISTPDPNPITGVRGSLTIGRDGLGILTYGVGGSCATSGTCPLRVAHCVDVLCTTATTHDIDPAGPGWYSSIKIGADGLPLISYAPEGGASYHKLRVAHCADIVCSSATLTTLDPAATVDDDTSLTIGTDGLGVIAYQDNLLSNVHRAIKTAHCQNVACTSALVSTVDTVGTNNGGSGGGLGTVAIAVNPGTGTPIVAYWDGYGTTALKVATCLNVDCSALSGRVILDPAHTYGSPAIAFGRDGLPLISYMGNGTASSSDLVVAHCVNVYCTAATTAAVHADGVDDGWYGKITVGADGLGVVVYTDATNHNLEVAHCVDVACTTLTHVVVDERDNQGFGSDSIVIGSDGLPLIGYYDVTNGLVKVAHCRDVACTQPFGSGFAHKGGGKTTANGRTSGGAGASSADSKAAAPTR
jgi:hypothetical protein